MRSRSLLAARFLGAVAVSLAIHAAGAGVALFSGEVPILASATTGDAIVAELLPAEPTAISRETLARMALRARGVPAQAAARPGRPSPTAAAPTSPRAPAGEPTDADEVVALVPPAQTRADVAPAPAAVVPGPASESVAPATSDDARPSGEADERPAPSEATPAVAKAEDDVADPRRAVSPGESEATPVSTAGADPTEATEADVALARAPASESSLMHGPTSLPAAPRSVVEDLAARASVSTRAESEPFLTRRAVFEFLLDHPEFATHVTRALKVGRYRIWRTAEGLFLDDGWGATGRLAVLHRTAGTRVMYAKGQYEALLVPNIRGEAVVVIEYVFRAVGGGMDLVSAAITGYVTLESRALALAAKLASGAAARKADAEVRKLLKNFAKVSRAIDENPGALVAQLRARPEVPSRELHEFAALLGLDR